MLATVALLRGRTRWLPTAVISVLALLTACQGTAVKGKPLEEDDIPLMRGLGQAFEQLPHSQTRVRSDATKDKEIELAFHEYGDTQPDRVLVFIHGVLSDQRAWRYVIGALGDRHEVWAVDLPGCGESDKPRPEDAKGPDPYSPTWMANHVMGCLKKQLVGRGEDLRITIVAHSLGGGVALRMLGDPDIAVNYPGVLKRIDGAVLLAPLEFGLDDYPESFDFLAEVKDWEVALGTIFDQVRQAATDAVYGREIDLERIPKREFVHLYEILKDSTRRRPMQAMLKRALPRDENEEIDKRAVNHLRAQYANVEVPCLILWGEDDDTLPPDSGSEIQKRNPDLVRQRRIANVKHSIQVEKPLLCAGMIEQFLKPGVFENFSPEIGPAVLPESKSERNAAISNQTEKVSSLQERSVATAPSSVSVLKGRTGTRSGARYVSDPFRMIPGVEVQRISSTESNIAFRGFAESSISAQGVLGILDGRQVYNAFLGNVQWDQLAVRLEDIDQSEVVRGPGSFVHGPNAMHGVISIETKSPLAYEESTASVTAHAGSYDSAVVGSTVVKRTTSSGFKISAQYDDIGQFENDRGGDTRNKGFVNAAYEWQLEGNEDHVIGLSGGFSQQEFDLLLIALEEIPQSNAADRARDLFFKIDYKQGDPKKLSFKGQLNWNGFDVEFDPAQYYEPFSLDLDTLYTDGRMTWITDPHQVTGGAGYRFSTFDTSDADVTDGSHSVNEFWVFAQDEWKLTDALELTFGARVDYHSEVGTNISPRLALVWRFKKNQYLRGSAGRGFRNPSLRELWFDMEITGVPGLPPITIAGNTDLKAESLTSYEIGYVGAWGTSNKLFEANANVYFNTIEDLVEFQGDPNDPLTVLPVNQENDEVFGFELEGRYFMDESLYAFGNYSYSRRKRHPAGEPSRTIPRHTVSAGVSYSSERWSVMLWANWRDASEFDAIPVDSYLLLNGSVSYRFDVAHKDSGPGQAFVRFFNLLNDKHREHPQGDEYGLIITGGLQFDW